MPYQNSDFEIIQIKHWWFPFKKELHKGYLEDSIIILTLSIVLEQLKQKNKTIIFKGKKNKIK